MIDRIRAWGLRTLRFVGLRTSESEVSVEVTGRWRGTFDLVRVVVAILVVVALVWTCTAIPSNDAAPLTGPYTSPAALPHKNRDHLAVVSALPAK